MLDRMANDDDAAVRRKALTVAKKVSWTGMEQGMIDHGLTDDDSMVRRDAVYGLLAIDSELGRPAIYEITKALPDKERASALRVWSKNVLAADRDFLIEMLDDPTEDAAVFATRALEALGDPSVAPILIEKANNTSGKRKDELIDAAEALR